MFSRATILWAGAALCACHPPQSTPPPNAAPGSHVTVPLEELSATLPERERMLAVLQSSGAEMQACYREALARDPRTYGDLVLRFVLDADGAVSEVSTHYTTLRDRAFEACVLQTAQALTFPAPSTAGLSLRYPYVFTTALTPPEITRALLLQHGLLSEEDLATDPMNFDEARPAPAGTVESW